MEINGRHPKPLSSIWAFFKSSSPLDDLFITFAWTRPLTQPLQRRNSLTVPQKSGDAQEKIDNDLESGLVVDTLERGVELEKENRKD